MIRPSKASATGTEPRRAADGRRHSTSRERTLRAIELGGAMSVAELAAATGLHENTVRGHLERLRADGHVRRERGTSNGRGRPAERWSAVPPESRGPYPGLAAALADALTRSTPDATAAAREAGVRWGHRIAESPTGESDTRELLLQIMREQGFAPDDGAEIIALRHCPLLAAAGRHPDVVCAAHEGMIEGIGRATSPDIRADLQPFATDGACLLRLQHAG